MQLALVDRLHRGLSSIGDRAEQPPVWGVPAVEAVAARAGLLLGVVDLPGRFNTEYDGLMVSLVWVDEWQMACCGDRFAVGDTVVWTLISPQINGRDEWVDTEIDEVVAYQEERHDRTSEGVKRRMQVASIRGVYREYEPVSPGSKEWRAVDGSTRLEYVSDSGEAAAADDAHRQLDAYLVEVNLQD